MNNALKKKDIEVSYTGYVQCFCNDRAAENDPSDLGYGSENYPVCQEYMDTKLPNFLASNSITVIITVINIIIKIVTVKLISWIGYDTHSELVTAISNGVFAA